MGEVALGAGVTAQPRTCKISPVSMAAEEQDLNTGSRIISPSHWKTYSNQITTSAAPARCQASNPLSHQRGQQIHARPCGDQVSTTERALTNIQRILDDHSPRQCRRLRATRPLHVKAWARILFLIEKCSSNYRWH